MANSVLQRQVTSAETPTKITWSVWVKRSELGRTMRIVSNALSNYMAYWRFSNSDTLEIWTQDGSGNAAFAFNTNRKFRDISAWYNIVMSVDTTQATESNRLKIWVNGIQETSFSQSNYPSQNETIGLFGSTSGTVQIGRYADNNTEFFSGYLSHLVITPGYAYANTDFGSFDATSGIWKFKPPVLSNWGTNGVHFKFENSGNLGLDSSGNGNNYTVVGNLKQSLDTPSNVYSTFSPLHYGDTAPSDSYGAFSNGNTTYASTQSGSPYPYTCSTLAASSGKWYAEFKILQVAGSSMVGITDGAKYPYLGDGSNKDACLFADGKFYPGNSSFGSAFSDNDICGVAMDLDNMKVYFHKNGTYFQSGDPTSGATGTGAANIPTGGLGQFHFAFGDSSGNTTSCSANFGNGFFGTTAITSAGSNGNGSLFEYDVPSGYYALNTKNLNTYG